MPRRALGGCGCVGGVWEEKEGRVETGSESSGEQWINNFMISCMFLPF